MNSLFVLDVTKAFPPADKYQDLASILNLLIPLIYIVAGIIFFIMIVFSGFSIIKGAGNPEELKKTQKMLTYSIVGFAIIVISYILVKLIAVIFNLNLPF